MKSDRNPNLTRNEIVVKNLSKFIKTFFEADEIGAQVLAQKIVHFLTEHGVNLRPRLKPWERKRIAEREQEIEAQKRYDFIEKELAKQRAQG